MIDSIPAVVGWIFVLIFAATASIVMLDLAGFRRIKDRTQRKWLFRGVIVSVVVAVGGLGTALFKNMDPSRPAPPPSPAAPRMLAEHNSAAPILTPAPRADEPEPARPEPTREPADEASPPSGELTEWAREHLGERPVIPDAFTREYPDCAAKLQKRGFADIDPSEALDCRDALEAHHQRYIVAFYKAKQPYDVAIRREERLLLARGLTPEELVLFNFVARENEDLNGPDGATNVARELAEERISADKIRCRKHRCSSRS